MDDERSLAEIDDEIEQGWPVIVDHPWSMALAADQLAYLRDEIHPHIAARITGTKGATKRAWQRLMERVERLLAIPSSAERVAALEAVPRAVPNPASPWARKG